MLILSFVLVLIDQISKYLIRIKLFEESISIIPNFLKFTYVENRGALFGIGQNSTFIFILLNLIIIIGIVIFYIKQRLKLSKIEKVSVAFVLSGGIGNLIDRILFGFVTDFLDISPFFSWPVFNFADIFVVVGCILLCISLLFGEKNERDNS